LTVAKALHIVCLIDGWMQFNPTHSTQFANDSMLHSDAAPHKVFVTVDGGRCRFLP
jgi:hypothetical protein